jgi:STELLO glycosyltransferases
MNSSASLKGSISIVMGAVGVYTIYWLMLLNAGSGKPSRTQARAVPQNSATSGATWVAREIRPPPGIWGDPWTWHNRTRLKWGRPRQQMPDIKPSACLNWAVITTVFGPTNLALQLSRVDGWCTVIIGDQKSPPKEDWLRSFQEMGGKPSSVHYLAAADQVALPFASAKALPWNHFGRKNVGYLYAIAKGAQVIYDTDDDNELHEPGPENRLSSATATLMSVRASPCLRLKIPAPDVYNPYPGFENVESTQVATTWPRGFPLDRIKDIATHNVSLTQASCSTTAILQSLADNDPDVDAIYRMTRHLPLNFRATPRLVNLPPGTMSPFNAQATLYHRDAFWGLLLPVTVHGRVSDILRSFLVQRLLWDAGRTLTFSHPFVKQVRNAHKYLADFVAEEPLYTKAGELIRYLIDWRAPSGPFHVKMLALTTKMFELGVVEQDDVRLVRTWIADLDA